MDLADTASVCVTAPQFMPLDTLISRKKLVTMAVLALCYIVVGGLVFHAIESPHEQQVWSTLEAQKTRFLEQHPCVEPEELTRLLEAVAEAANTVDIRTDNQTNSAKWTVLNGIFLATTVVSTIGYGHLSPSTTAGRWFCILFALIGIPLFMTPVCAAGDYINRKSQHLVKHSRPGKLFPQMWELLRVMMIFLTGLAFVVLFPAILFGLYEEWDLCDSVYYALMTCLTIGFGDLVAGENPDRSYPAWYMLFRQVWIISGLIWVSLVLGLTASFLARLKMPSCYGTDFNNNSTSWQHIDASLNSMERHYNRSVEKYLCDNAEDSLDPEIHPLLTKKTAT